jgi:hypothetical protein
MFPNNTEQIKEYITDIQAYDDITLSKLEEEFKIFLNFYKKNLEA